MKKVLLFLTIITLSLNLNAQSRKERKAQKKAELETKYQSTRELIDSENFQFVALWANPLGNDAVRIGQSLPGGAAVFQGNRVSLVGNDNHVKITQNEADIFLPFFGRVFFPKRINNQRGIAYKGVIDNYTISTNEKKKVITIKFNTKTEDDNLKIILRVTAGGSAVLNVNSTNRQTISYDGNIKAIK